MFQTWLARFGITAAFSGCVLAGGCASIPRIADCGSVPSYNAPAISFEKLIAYDRARIDCDQMRMDADEAAHDAAAYRRDAYKRYVDSESREYDFGDTDDETD